MAAFDIEIYGMTQIAEALTNYPTIAEPIMRQTSDRALLGMVPALADYPPELPNQKYVRTQNLERAWRNAQPEFQVIPTGFESSIANSMPYSAWVQGPPEDDPHQAWMHKDRWKTTTTIADVRRVDIELDFEAALQLVADALDAAAQGGTP